MRIDIDFAPSRKRIPLRGLIFLIASLIALATAAWDTANTWKSLSELEGRSAKTQRADFHRQAMLPPAQLAAVNQAIRQLNLPWPSLLAAIEEQSSERVALLSLEPDSASRILRITAEAKSPDEMLDFISDLASDLAFSRAILQRHEINESDRNRPYRFVVEATWQID